jgi:hydrogenase-4 component B
LTSLLAWGVGLILGGGGAAALWHRTPRAADALFRTLVVVGCTLAAVPAAATLLGHAPPMRTWQPFVPGGAWVIGLDPLSAWFLLLIALVGAASAAYGVSYLGAERSHRPVAAAHLGFAVLLAGMMGVVLTRAAVPFLMAWELMAVSAYFLIVYEGERAEVARAGLVYLILTHVGTLALFAMFLAWRAPGADLTFRSLGLASAGLPWGGAVILLLALVGFGMKAGMVPLHVWLPGAHAAAPSHVSALLSGVMLKTGIYGLLRVMSLLGVVPAWWGWTLLGLGLVSGVLGVLWALAQHDLKRVLAYSSVENVGIILLGMGVGALGVAYRQPVVAVLGFTGAVLHALNHALFKSLLFLGAGAVLRATGTRRIDALGGVGRRMPWTAAAFLLGSVAIVGLPPLNGFVSEWIVFQALLHGGGASGPLRLASVAAPGLAAIGGLALACFTKVDGVVFLGRARSRAGGEATEPGSAVVGPMVALAAACLAIGVYPAFAVAPAIAVGASVAGGSVVSSADLARLVAALPAITLAALALILLCGILWLARGYRLARVSAPEASTWACAGAPLTSRMQYTASSYAAPLLSSFGSLSGVRAHADAAGFHSHPIDLVLDGLVAPAWRQVGRVAREARLLQAGRLRWYLLYVILTVLALLLYVSRTPGAR